MDSEAQSVNLDPRRVMEEELYDQVAQRLIDGLSREPKKKYGTEQLKALGAKEFSGIVEPKQAEKWLRTLEKCFRVMQCPQGKRWT